MIGWSERGWKLLAVCGAAIGCTSRSEAIDPLQEMWLARCGQQTRCGCSDEEEDVDCGPYARTQAAEQREQGAKRGAYLLDEACAELSRELAETVCVDERGIPYAESDAELAARVRECMRTLVHGERRLGEPCEHPFALPDLRSSDCEAGAACMDDGTGPRCVPYPSFRPHDLCFDIDVSFPCPANEACVPIDADTSECQPFTIVGAPCVGFTGDYCEGPPGQWCDPPTSTCRARPGPGEPCLASAPNVGHRCADGIFCDPLCSYDAQCRDGGCERRPTAGEACTGYGSCALGLECMDGVCMGDEGCWYP